MLKTGLTELVYVNDLVGVAVLELALGFILVLTGAQDLILIELNVMIAAWLVGRIVELQDGVNVRADVIAVKNVFYIVEQLLGLPDLSDLRHLLDALDSLFFQVYGQLTVKHAFTIALSSLRDQTHLFRLLH